MPSTPSPTALTAEAGITIDQAAINAVHAQSCPDAAVARLSPTFERGWAQGKNQIV